MCATYLYNLKIGLSEEFKHRYRIVRYEDVSIVAIGIATNTLLGILKSIFVHALPLLCKRVYEIFLFFPVQCLFAPKVYVVRACVCTVCVRTCALCMLLYQISRVQKLD